MEPLGDITLSIETSNPSAPGAPGVCIGQLRALGTPDLVEGEVLGTPDLRAGEVSGTPDLRAGNVLGTPDLQTDALASRFDGVHLLSTASITDHPSTPKQRSEDRLMLAIDQALRAASLAPRQIKRIAISIGPGGFTSVRLAVTTAKCIAEVTGAACIPVPTALVAAVRFAAVRFAAVRFAAVRFAADARPTTPAPAAPITFAVALASKGLDAYVQVFTTHHAPPGVAPLTPGAVLDAQGLTDLARVHLITTLLADDFLPQPMRHRATELGIAIAPISLDPAACLAASRNLEPVDPVNLLPLYPREPEAVTKWRQLHGDRPH